MLELKNLNVYYGAIHALKSLNVNIDKGEIVTLIGANGAGKSTTLKTISGLLKPRTGEVIFDGKSIYNLSAPEIVKKGIVHVPEGRRIFSTMSVLENLEMGAFTKNNKTEIAEDIEKAYTYFPILKERREQLAGTLSGGEQQMLAIARGLMSRPKLILLDEPSMGLAPIIVNEIFNIIKTINKSGTTVLLVEQNANMALKIADRAYIIRTGEIELEGKAKDLLKDESVRKAYLEG
ncbi:ABC transporter ATP-binding protein [Tissierella creatinini]|nr:ABC transporter ATP-binding protein [Tissierella creatinini]TJX64693.1 ABC transporter ATP-binding protein [Soehngenia saccharolytica]